MSTGNAKGWEPASSPYVQSLVWRVHEDVNTEINRAINKHGLERTPYSRELSSADKLVILAEEFGEIARALSYDATEAARDNLRLELIQLAAVATLWAASLPES